jgi:hypothetical protein
MKKVTKQQIALVAGKIDAVQKSAWTCFDE